MWTIRPMKNEDYGFILSSYMRSCRDRFDNYAVIDDLYYPEARARLDRLLATEQVLIACSSDDVDQIAGYVIAAPDTGKWSTVHYLYVKRPFRALGVGTRLLQTAVPEIGQRLTMVTHLPKSWKTVSSKYRLIYNPYKVSQT